ncbi:hypothetical protein LAZ67_2000305 [Cordylochernes scorpioides]|uniref:RNA-directed DNA polymerase from mobile element jockey n=1 Tax=Cordylochernes scorpioides TaxID=51811 RepID=A0ABY6K0B1_9ARAC|nr:hypothetical protein LAZ67_2000305 [Cordylochernes scorpioides]
MIIMVVRLALHALPHPAHPASARQSCVACGSIDLPTGTGPVAVFSSGRAESSGGGLDDGTLPILASAKTRGYKYFLNVELTRFQEDPLLFWKMTLSRAERKLNLFINNSQITHSEHPKYLGIHLDRTLTFKTHLTKLKGKLSSRNNILHNLAGSSWGSDANTLRTSALALIFSTAEYCAPVWEGSCHTKLIDTQLNSTLRIITGVCQPTRIDWLPVLAHISPPELRRKEATKKMYQKLLDSPDLEINPILQGNQLLSQNFNISEAWTNSWISSDIPNKNLITSPSVKIPGFSLPRREWVLLNRFRTGQGRCAELMKLWGYTKDPNCACNVPQSMSHILDDCPQYKFNGGISILSPRKP